jgi:aminopeptidase N
LENNQHKNSKFIFEVADNNFVMKANRFLVICTLVLAAVYGCTHPTPWPEKGVSQQLARQRSSQISNLVYDLHLTIPALKDSLITGRAKINFQLNHKKEDLFLDFKADTSQLNVLIVNGDTLPHPQLENEHIRLHRKYLKKGSNEIVVHFIPGNDALNRNERYFYSLFVPDRARTVLPCFDQPDIKGRFSVTMEIPLNWTGIANGALENEVVKDGVKQLTFSPSEPISTYLWAFAAGEFKYEAIPWGNLQIGLFHLEDDSLKLRRNQTVIFNQVVESLNWLENYTGVKYPFSSYNLVAIPSFQFGGMEHSGATWYRAERIFLDENPTREEELARANLIAHETAHMWFGDLVTMPWFDEVWLKEVFANFMADKITESWFPEMDHQLRFLLAHFPNAYSVDRTPGANPIGQKLDNLQNAGTLYGTIIYNKSPIVMSHLEQMAGEAPLQKAIQSYLTDFAYGNASWNDLVERVSRYSENDLRQWSEAWVYQPGRPVLSVQPLAGQPNKWRLMQQPEHSVNTGKAVWPQQVTILSDTAFYRYGLNDSMLVVDMNLLADHVLLLADEKGYGLVRMTPGQSDYWRGNAQRLREPVLRARLAINLYENLLDGTVDPRQYMDFLLRSIHDETNPLLIGLYTGYLTKTYWWQSSQHDFGNLTLQVEKVLWDKLNQVESLSTQKTLLKAWAKVVNSPEGLAKLAALCLNSGATKGLVLSEKDRIEMVCELMVRGYPESEAFAQKVTKGLKDANNREMLRFILPALSHEVSVRDSFFASLSDRNNRRKEKWVEMALGYLHHPLRHETSIHYLPQTLQMLEEIQTTGDIFFPIGWLNQSFGTYYSQKASNVADEFLKVNPDTPEHLKLKILQSVDGVRRSANVNEIYR